MKVGKIIRITNIRINCFSCNNNVLLLEVVGVVKDIVEDTFSLGLVQNVSCPNCGAHIVEISGSVSSLTKLGSQWPFTN